MSSSNFEILWSPEAANTLRNGRGNLDPHEYIQRLGTRCGKSASLVMTVECAAAEIEPYDRVTGFPEPAECAQAFCDGATPAIYLAQKYLTLIERDDMAYQEIDIFCPTDEGSPEFADQQEASYFAHMEIAGKGWALAEPAFGDLFEEWEPSACPDVSKQIYLRSGFGFVIYLASQIHHKTLAKELEFLADEVATEEFDWDAALAGLASSPDDN